MSSAYTSKVPPEEIERLMRMIREHPMKATTAVLDQYDLRGRSFVDLGCGPSPELGKYIVIGREGQYTGVDHSEPMAARLRSELDRVELPIGHANVFVDGMLTGHFSRYDIHFERFVLMHMSRANQLRAMRKMLTESKAYAFFVEYDWAPMMESCDHPLFYRAVAAFMSAFAVVGSDPFLGRQLGGLVGYQMDECRLTHIADLRTVTDCRPKGDYTKELAWLADGIGSMIALQSKHVGDELHAIRDELLVTPFEFIPAEIVIAAVKHRKV